MTLFEVVNVNEDRQIVYLSRDDIKKLGIEEKDTVKVFGRAGCAAAVVLADNKMKDGRIGIGTLKESIGVGQGHTVRVSPVKFCGEAKKVLVRVFPARGVSLKAVMLGKLIVENQKLRVEEDGRITKIKVLKTDGDGCYIVKDTTEIEVAADKELNIPAVSLKDVGGLDDVIEKLRELVNAAVLTPERFYAAGLRPPRGVLLYGPPGTGKTLLAKALANEAGANFYYVNAADILSKFVGESEQNIKKLFEEARRKAPSIVFFDEIDAIAQKRGEYTNTSGTGILQTLLSEMDGIDSADEVFVIAATNRPESLDIALRRAGRFDTEFEICVPNYQQRLSILKVITRSMRIVASLEDIARKTTGFTGADLENLCRNAFLASMKRGSQYVTQEDFDEAMKSIVPSGLRDVAVEIEQITFDDIHGYEEVKKLIHERVILPYKNTDYFKALGITPPRGILLYGPPGTGKTYFARAIAGTLGFNVITISAAELISKWIGESEENIIRIFRKARTYSPTVILFDEIDAIASRRVEHDYVGRRITTQLIAEMDGAKNLKDVLVIGTTNRIDIIDPALLRPGRFDLKIEIPLPNLKDRIEILKAYLKDQVDDDVLVVAQMMDGFSTAEIVHVILNAKLNAAKRGLERKINPNNLKIDFEDFENAISALNRKE